MSTGDHETVETFILSASTDMEQRMFDGLSRGWGTSWQTDYRDDEAVHRFLRAGWHLVGVLEAYRSGSVGLEEVRKRAADVANQAFMLADPERLENGS